MTVPEQALLPCPFCGAEASLYRGMTEGNIGRARIYCASANCFGPRTTAENFEDAAVQWNQRAPLMGVDRHERLRVALTELLADIDDPELAEISNATIARARQALAIVAEKQTP